MDLVPLAVGADEVVVEAAVSCSSDQFEVSSGVSNKVFSG